MSADTLFFSGIYKLKILVIINVVVRMFVWALVIFLGTYTAVIAIEKAGFSFINADKFFYGASLGVSLLLSLLYGYVQRGPLIDKLIEIDTRLALQDRISTAYEYQQLGKRSVFVDLLTADAGYRLSQLSKKQIFPLKFSYVHLLLAILIFVNVFLYYGDRLFPVSRLTSADQEKLKNISTLLNGYISRKSESVNRTIENPYSDPYKKLKQIAQKIDHRSLSQEDLWASMNKLLLEIQAEQARFAERLSLKLENAGLENMLNQEIIQIGKITSSNLKKLNIKINQMFKNRVPASINRDLAVLEEYRNLDKFLSQIIDDLEEIKFDQADNKLEEINKKAEDKNRDKNLIQNGQGKMVPGGIQDNVNSEGGGGPDKRASSAAGNAKSENPAKSPYEFQKLKGPALQDKIISRPEENFHVHIRSLAAMRGSKLKAADITRPYRKEIESILAKEDIPLNYREYIKNYFLSIGLATGTKQQ